MHCGRGRGGAGRTKPARPEHPGAQRNKRPVVRHLRGAARLQRVSHRLGRRHVGTSTWRASLLDVRPQYESRRKQWQRVFLVPSSRPTSSVCRTPGPTPAFCSAKIIKLYMEELPHPGELPVNLGSILARADDEDRGEGREARRDVHHDTPRKIHHLAPPAPAPSVGEQTRRSAFAVRVDGRPLYVLGGRCGQCQR